MSGFPQRPLQSVRAPTSSRTLQHPSFMSLYMTSAACGHTVCPMTPAEIFYRDPSTRMRIPNTVAGIQLLPYAKLNSPLPIMSTPQGPLREPDLFRAAPHPTRDLGSSTWRTHGLEPPLAPPRRAVIELTQEEDQAITNLLKLRHQEAPQSQRMDLQGGSGWSHEELEVAETLLRGFNPLREDMAACEEPSSSS